MDLIPGYQGYLDQYRPPGYDGNGAASGPPPLVYPEEVGERRRAVSGDRMVILPRRPSEEPDYVIPSSAMQQMLQERDRTRRQAEWGAGVSATGPPPRVPHLGYPSCHEQYPDQGRLAQESEKLSSQEKERRKIHAASEHYRKMREETAMRNSEFVMSPLGSQQSPGALSLGSPGIPSPQNSTPQSSPLMAGLVSPTGGPSGSRQGRGRKNSEPPQRMAGHHMRYWDYWPHWDPNCAGPNGNVNPNANIDLGALYQQTVENRVTRTFSQHWIIVGKHLRVLLLDFDAKFTLLIPNIELGKAFRINKADVEVQTKELEGGHKLTFMKFIFQSPALEIKAPVLNDKTVGYQVLQQNGACVFLSRIFNIPTLPPNQGEPAPSPSSHPIFTNGNSRPQHPAHQMGPAYRGPPTGPVHQPLRYPGPVASSNQHLGPGPSHLATAMLQQQGRRPSQMGRSQFSDGPGHPNIPSSVHSLQSPINPLPPPMPIHSMSPPEQQQNSTTNSNSKNNCSSQMSPLSCGNSSLPPISSLKPQENHTKKESFQVSQTERRPMQNFFELYAALNNEEYAKMTTCSFCQRKFRFTSVLLDHLQTHTVNVDNIVEMKLKIWVNGRKLKCSEAGCKKKYAYTLEYTKHRDSHHYEGLSCGVCGCTQLGPADYASHIKKEHPDQITSTETQAEDLPPPPSEAKEEPQQQQQQVSIPSPAVSEAQSPMINQHMQAPTTPSSDIQVHTPKSAPPMMMASPQMSPLSQQPKSAPPNTEFSDDFTSAINMPIIDEDALNPPVPDVINKDNEDQMLMNILEDLKGCTENPNNPPEPSPGAPQSNAQILTDFEMQQENQKFSFHHYEKTEEHQNFHSSETHPIILSQRPFSTEVNSPGVNSPVQYENSGQSPQVMDQIPVTNEDKNLQSQSQSYHDMNPPSYHIEETNSPTQSRSPGVIRRVLDVTDPTNQCYMNMSSPVTQNNSPGNQNMLSNASPHQNMMAYASPATQPSPLATHSYPHDGSPMMNQINVQQNQQISRMRHHSFSYPQSCVENSVNSSCSEFQNSDMVYATSSQTFGGTPPQSNKIYQDYPPNQEYSGSGSHSSHAVRALVANKIWRRKSRSSSFDSEKSESRMTADNSDQFTPQSPHTPQGAKCTETKLASVITARHVSESEVDKQMYQISDIPKSSSQESFDFIQTSSEDPSLLPTMINEMNAQLNAAESTEQAKPVHSANKPQPVLNQEPDSKDFPTCDNCGQSFRGKAAIASHVRYCLERKTGISSAGQQAGAELSNTVTCHKPDECKTELACAQPQVPVLGLPNHAEKLEKNNTENIDEAAPVIEETDKFNCDNCTDKFITENSMRIHVAQCGKARIAESVQSELHAIENMSMDCDNSEGFQQDDSNYNSDEKDSMSQSKVTPIKSWLRKHMDSVKSPEHVANKLSPEQKPLYIIPQEPEERTCDAYSSGTSSSEDEDSPKKHKKSPKRRGRPSKNEKGGEKVNYDTKLSTDPVGGIKIKFSKNCIDTEVDNDEDKEKRPRGRPKGSKNRPKDERIQKAGSKTPKKSKKLAYLSLIPEPPSKTVPAKNTTPSPPNSNLLKSSSPNSGLSYNLTSLGPSLEEIARPGSKSPTRLSESSGSSSDSDSSSESEHSRAGSVTYVRDASKSPEIVVVDTIVNKPRKSFEEDFDDFIPILEVASPKEPTPDIADNLMDNQESESEMIDNFSPTNNSSYANIPAKVKQRDSFEQKYGDKEHFDERCSRSPSPLSTSVDEGNCMSPSQRNNKSQPTSSPAEVSEDTSILLTSHSNSSKTELNASSESRADTPDDVPDLPKDETMRSRSSSRSSLESRQIQRSRSNSYLSPVPSRSLSPSANDSPSRESSPLKRRSQSRSSSASPNRASSRNHRSSSSSSSSSSESESSSGNSRSSSPEIPKTPELAPVQQLPIPKLRIKLNKLVTNPTNSAYKPVKVITSPYQPDIKPTFNGFANKLRSLNCKVNVPRLKFKVLDEDMEIQKAVKLHEKDIEELSDHKVAASKKDKKLSEPETSNPEINRPPIAPIKIRLRTSSETVPNTGRSLSSILAEIVKEPCKMTPSTVKDLSEFEIPNSETLGEVDFLFTSSLTESFSALTKFVETEICRDILNDVVIKVEEGQKVSSDIIHEILDEIFFNEACCANILDNVVEMVVQNVEAKKEHIENERKADIMAQRKFMEQQKLKASAQEITNKKDEFQAVKSVNMQKLHDNVKKINEVENQKNVEFPQVEQINDKSEQEDDIEVLKSTFEVYVSDEESSIELSDSEFDLDGENPSIIEELKFDNPEEPEHADTTVLSNDTHIAVEESIDEESKLDEASDEKTNVEDRPPSNDKQLQKKDNILTPALEENNSGSSEKGITKTKRTSPNLSKRLKQKKVPKLLIKPIRKEEKNGNMTEDNTQLVKEMATNTVNQPGCLEKETKMPPIIVKIPKVSISPKKTSKKENVKSPSKTCIKNLDFSYSKQPIVSIKNLKILPPVPPEVTEAILELANADEEISDDRREDKKLNTLNHSPLKHLSSKLRLQTPPPLCVIKNKRKAKSPEISESTCEQKEKEKESIVTVLKMSEIVSMKRKEEELDRQNDLKKMLELENKLKVEDENRMKEEKIKAEQNKKKSCKISPKSKSSKETKESKKVKEPKQCTSQSDLKMTESHKQNDLEKMLELENKLKIENRNRIKEEKIQTEQTKTKPCKGSQKSKTVKETKQVKPDETNKKKTECSKGNSSDGSKFVILAKKSPPKPKINKTNEVIPLTPVAKKAHGTPAPQPDSEKKIEQAAKVGLQRRNSVPKHKEQWVVSERIKTPSPTPPTGPAPFVAKKSRPDETVSFSLPAGGFRPSSVIPAKPKPLLMQVDELFSQYFPGVKEDMKAFNETPALESIDNANEKQETFKQNNTLVEVILEELLLRVVKISMQRKLACQIKNNQDQKETKTLVTKPEENLRSREVSPDYSTRSRNVSADSSRSGFSSNSNESLEVNKEEYCHSERDFLNKRKKRKSENLGLNGGYWDAIGVRGVVREKLEKQESIEKAEKPSIKNEKKSKLKEVSKKVYRKEKEVNAELIQDIHDHNVNKSINQSNSESIVSENQENSILYTTNENITFVQAIINDIILSLKTIEDTQSPPKQTSIKRSPPTENKPSKKLKTTVAEIGDQNTKIYEIEDVLPHINFKELSTDEHLIHITPKIEANRDKIPICEKLSNIEEKSEHRDTETKLVIHENKSNKSEIFIVTKMGKKSPETYKKRASILQIEKKDSNIEKVSSSQDVYEFEDDDEPSQTKSNTETFQDFKVNEENLDNTIVVSISDQSTNEMDLKDELAEDQEEVTEINTDIWSSINETLKDLKEGRKIKERRKSLNAENSSFTKEKFEALEDCKDSLLDDLNSSNNSELDGWPFDGDNLKDEITGDNIDIWASTNEIMRSISESLSDVKTVKPEESSTTLRDKKEAKPSQEITVSRKSRQKRKDSEEILGNPDSGKENADIDNLDMAKTDPKKSERVLSPVTKRRKIVNRKYINDDFDDSHSPNRQKDSKPNYEKDSQTKRRRSNSSSSEEGLGNDAKKTLLEFSEKVSKQVKNPFYKQNLGRKTIQIIDPSPTDPECLKEKSVKSKALKTSPKKKGEQVKNDLSVKGKITDTKETKKSSSSSLSKSKSIWSSKPSIKSKTKPSTDLVSYLDTEYEKAKNEEVSKMKLSKK